MGGLGGHMAHLSEDLDLTFNEIVDILGKVARAEIKTATEKVDGQNLFLSVDYEGNIRTARNATDIKRGGMTPSEYVAKWEGHPAESAFTNGFKATTAALKKLDDRTLQELFSGGKRYINMEIMYPKNPNIIHYTSPQIVLHGLKYVGELEDKEEQKRQESLADEAFDELAGLVDAATAEIGEEIWTINGPKVVELNKLADGVALEAVTAAIERYAEPVGMSATLGDMVGLRMRQMAENEGLPHDVTEEMVKLVLDPDRAKKEGITTSSLKKQLPKELRPVISRLGTKTTSRKVIGSILYPLEVAISDFAIEVLRGLQSFFVSGHDTEMIRQQQELERSIEYLRALEASGDPKMGELVDKQLAKLGKIENLASTLEGVVFEYPPGSGKIYKLTGAFAMANQIIGRARRSGMKESVSGEFTIRISDTQSVTKPLAEWLYEMKEAKHKVGTVPKPVYRDILNGVPVVDIVRHADAQDAIYNTIYQYANGLLENREIILEIEDNIYVEDEDMDPVGIPEGYTVAIVPGAFKPPHLGHLDMVRRYAEGDGVKRADEVIVLISNPLKQQRTIGKGGRPITAEDSERIWELLVGAMPNVTIQRSSMASPIQAAYEYIGPAGPLEPGMHVILGASRKGDDWKRWQGADKYIKPGVVLEDVELNAVDPSMRPNGEPYSASDFRELLSSPEASIDEIAEFVGSRENAARVLEVLGIETPMPMEEMSSGAGGAVGGFSGPFGRSSPVKKRKKRKKKKHESINLSVVDEVFKLLNERGIIT